ncbi:hypothetical protein ACLKA7_000213 [Drosophila subpalustris]
MVNCYLRALFRLKRKKFKDAIKLSKARHFQELCEAADSQPFGSAYKMVMDEPEPVLTSIDKALNLASKIKTSKAVGPDGIPNASIKAAIAAKPEVFVELYNKCIVEGTVSRRWKLQRLVLIPKAGHGCFKPYLHRFNHAEDPFCDHCGQGIIEDAEHSFFFCPLFGRERGMSAIGRLHLTPDNLVAHMLAEESTCTDISNLAAHILKDLRLRERLRNGATN